MINIAEQERPEQTVRRSIKELADIKFALDESSIVAITNQKGEITFVNDKFCDISGFSREELIGQDHAIINSAYHSKEFIRRIWVTIASGQVWHGDIKNRSKSGSFYWVDTTIVPFLNKDGKPYQYVAIRTDITERKQFENDLMESRAQLSTIVENLNEGVVVADMGGNLLQLNRATLNMYGADTLETFFKDQSEFAETFELSLLDGTVLSQEQWPLARVIRGEKLRNWEVRLLNTRTGWDRIFNYTGTLARDIDGNPLMAVVTITDITERKKAEGILGESEERYREMVENAHDVIYSHDLKGNYTSMNAAGQRISGYTLAEALKINLTDTIAPEYRAKAVDMIARKLAGEAETVYDLEMLAKDGRAVAVEVNTRLMYKDGVPVGVQGIARDITDRKLAERSLRESEQNFRALVQATTQFVWTMNADGESEELPRWWMDLTGQDLKEKRGDGWYEALHPDERYEIKKVWENAFENKKTFDVEYRILTKEREYRHFAVRGVPVINTDGSFRQWIGTFTDVTERKRAEEALRASEEESRQSQKLESIGLLAGGIAHDFNNLLTAINGYSELSLRSLPEGDPLRPNLEEIKKAGERAASLTHQLLAFSRKQVLQPQILALNLIVADMEKMLKRLIGEDIDLQTALEPTLGMVKADPGQVEQVIMNLVVNARDAMPGVGTLIIKTCNVELDEKFTSQHIGVTSGPYIMLTISDTGSGMDEEVQKHIFEPFFTTKEQGKGTGLGLSTVYGIISQSEGILTVDSAVGRGTSFNVYLPCLEGCVHKPTPAPTGEYGGCETILLVEDEETVRKLTREALGSWGYTVVIAQNGVDAIAESERQGGKIDLLLTDVVMPQMGGRELAETLNRKYPQIRVLFTSGYTDDAVVRQGIGSEGINFIQKPFNLDALARKVRETLDA